MRILSIILLLFTGITAAYGGIMLILDPIQGGGLQLSPALLKAGPFKDYFVPGMVLFTALGLGSLFSAVVAIMRAQNYYILITASGVVNITWILTQLFIIQQFHILQLVYGSIGIALLGMGLILWNMAYAAQVKAASDDIFWE